MFKKIFKNMNQESTENIEKEIINETKRYDKSEYIKLEDTAQ